MEPTPQDDPAARFKKPSDPPAQPQEPEAPAPVPAGFGQMLEDTLIAPFALGKVFARQALSPSPDLGVLSANIAVYAASFAALLFLRFHLTFPESAALISPAKHAFALVFAVSSITCGSLICAVVLQILSQAAGGLADYRRCYHVLSLLALFLPASAAASVFPFGWPALSLLWTYLAVVAAENLLQAPAPRAGAVFGGAGVVLIGGVWLASVQIEKHIMPFVQAAQFSAQLARQSRDAQASTTAAELAPRVDASSSTIDPQAQARQIMQSFQQGSSLNLVSAPGAGPGTTPAQAMAIAQDIQRQTAASPQAAANTLNSVMPLLENPALTKGMSPEQIKQLQDMTALVKQLQGNMATGKPMTPDQQAQIMKVQQAAMQSMMQQMQKRNQAPAVRPQLQQPAPQGSQQ